MKKSLRYLPENKRFDLRELTGIIREEIEGCAMVILYGSYARGKYVDYDQRTEFGVPTYFMSDYDILVLTEKRLAGLPEKNILDKINRRFFQNKEWSFHTHPQIITETIKEFNRQIEKSRYFYTDIKKEGVLLFDSGKHKLARRRRLNYSEIAEMAHEYFEDKFATAVEFLYLSNDSYNRGNYRMASFNLHQSVENLLRTISLVFILYGYKDHDLEALMNYAKRHTMEICQVLPRDTQEEERLFRLLQDAYVQARYNKNFVVAKEDIDALMPRIEQLRDITDKVCREKIAEYEMLSRKPEKRK